MIRIFGDSWAEPYGNNNEQILEHCWADPDPNVIPDNRDGLAKIPHDRQWYGKFDEPVANYAMAGTGPDHTLKQFHSLLESNSFERDDKFIFILSSPFRIHWINQKDAMAYDQSFYDGKCTDGFLRTIYSSIETNLMRSNIILTHFLSSMSRLHNWQVCIFFVFPHDYNPKVFYDKNNRTDTEYSIKEYALTELNSKSFYVHQNPLTLECYDDQFNDRNPYGEEGFLNHMSPENHTILYNICSNHFYNTTLPTKFHGSKDPLYFRSGGDKTMYKPKFIYE